MVFKLCSDVREISTTGGTGNQVLAGALDASYFAFGARYSDGDTLFYCAKQGTARELGKATYNAGANSLSRTQIYKSTNSNALVSFTPGQAVDIFVTFMASDDLDAAGLALLRSSIGIPADIATLTAAQTLSNKTLASPTITGAWAITGSQAIGANSQNTTLTINGGTTTGTGAAMNFMGNGSQGCIVGNEIAILGSGSYQKLTMYSANTTFRFFGLGAGTLTTDSSGNVSASSDETLKNVHGAFDRGLPDILKIDPITYSWNEESGMETKGRYSGFSAQNVQKAIPEAVGASGDGILSLQDRPIIAALVNAVKELSHRVAELESKASV